jgi:hypothetical protein
VIATSIETIPQTWDDGRDVPFFSLMARTFSSAFAAGATAMLAANDVDEQAFALAGVR